LVSERAPLVLRDSGYSIRDAGRAEPESLSVSVGVVELTAPVVFMGELPDKTMVASIVLASRGRALAVWAGAAGAFLIHVIIATTIGVALFHLLPDRLLSVVVAVLFGAGAVYMLCRKGEDEIERVALATSGPSVGRACLVAFVVVFLAEWGDLTQILTAELAARYHDPVGVAVGAVLGLWLVVALGVVGGRVVSRLVPMRFIRWTTAAILAVLGATTAISAAFE
jgi:putative Ca2+/H+ antiporter (TMEM165/GDT1 family)